MALARALVNRPKVLLLDEPLGALDLKLREEMQVELKAIQHEVGITFVFVTHDQDEALSMSDRVAVFNQGRIEQVGTPREIYEHPATAFVAGFVGTTNVLARRRRRAAARPRRPLHRPARAHPPRRRRAAAWPTATSPSTAPCTTCSTSAPTPATSSRSTAAAQLVATVPNDGLADELATPGLPVQLAWRRDHASALSEPVPPADTMTTTPGGTTT